MLKVFTRIVGVIPLIIGLLLSIYAIKNMADYYVSGKWPNVSGTVLSSKVGATGNKIKSSTVIAKVNYTYEVKGVSYQSSRISHNDYGTDSLERNKIISDRYPENAEVKVFYDPNRPSSSILEYKLPFSYILILGGGVIFILIGYFIILVAPKFFSQDINKYFNKVLKS
jgi:hypothetical protein